MIRKTRNYSEFIKPNWQRPVEEKEVKRMERSFEENGNKLSIYPIKVKIRPEDGKKIILDGQHRFEAAKNRGEEIFYQEVPSGQVTAQSLAKISRASHKWSTKDILHSYASRNKEPYVFIKETMEKHDLPVSSLFVFIGSTQDDNRAFREGRTTFTATQKKKINEFLEYANKVGEYLPVRKKSVLRALFVMYHAPGCDRDRLYRRCQTYPGRFTARSSYKDTVDQFVELYNYRTNRTEKIAIIL